MNEAEEYFTDLVNAIALCVATSLREMDGRVEGNFKSHVVAQAIRQIKIPANARNSAAITAVYQTFVAAIERKPEDAPGIPLPSASGKQRKTPSQAKRTS